MNKQSQHTQFALNGALLTVIYNKLATSEKESEALLYGQIESSHSERSHDQHESVVQSSTVLSFQEAVFMDRSYIFTQLEQVTPDYQKKSEEISEIISQFSTGKFLGWCAVAKNRSLNLKPHERERCAILMERLLLEKLYFGIFTYSSLNNQDIAQPETGQNYDTNHIVQFQFKIYEATIEANHQILFNPIKVNIHNLVHTQQSMGDMIPMSNFKFVTSSAIKQLEAIGEQVKIQILQMTKAKEKPYQELRALEKERQKQVLKNKRMKEELNELIESFTEIKKQNQIE